MTDPPAILSKVGAEFEVVSEFGQRLMDVSIAVVGNAKVELTHEFARDPKVVSLCILGRTISNFRATMALLHQESVLEARVLVRVMIENLLWIAALRERGSDFVQAMLKDEAHNRESLGRLTLEVSARNGGDTTRPDALRLRSLIADLQKQLPRGEKLHADKTAAAGVASLAYVDYARLSLDAVHCSITALGRHLSSEHQAGVTELTVGVVPRFEATEALATAKLACRTLMGAAIAANELVGSTSESVVLGRMLDEFERNGWLS